MEDAIKLIWEAHAELEKEKIGVGNLESKDEIKMAQTQLRWVIRYLEGVNVGLQNIQRNSDAWGRVVFPPVGVED